MRDTNPDYKLPTIIVTTPTETAYHEGLREITGRVGVASWQVKLLQAWWQSCHLDTSISKGVVSSCWWDVVGELDGGMVTHVVNFLLGDQVAYDSIPADRVGILRRLKRKILAGTLPVSLTL